MAIADTTAAELARARKGPSDQRAVQDQKEGKTLERGIRDAHDGHVERRSLHDGDGLADLRQLHGKDVGEGATALHDADDVIDARRSHDGDGESDPRHMHDAEGLSDQRRMQDAQGLSDMREMDDQHGLGSGGVIGDVALDGNEADTDASADELAEHPEADAEAMSDPDLTFKVEEDATPWALSIHLEERIANLGESTAKVNRQLDRFEESIQRLTKRIAK